MLATCKEKYPYFFLFKSVICQLVTSCLFTIVLYAMANISGNAVLGSLVRFFSVI